MTTHTDHGIGDGPNDWQAVPWDQQTWEERVLSASASWQPPDWRKEPGDVDHDPDSYGWALFEVFTIALRPMSDDGGDWPTNWLEHALDFARRLDGTDDSTGVLTDRRQPRPCLTIRERNSKAS